MRVGIHRIDARLRAPFVSSQGTVDTVPLVLLRLEGADGFVGVGEAVALGIPDDQVQIALEDCREVLRESDGEPIGELLAACANLAVLPQAIAAIDLALLDLAGRRAGLPVWQLLSGPGATPEPEPIAVNATIAAADRAGAAAAAASARIDGFRCVKVKVGLGDDAGRVAAVRAAGGPEMSIRLDANGAWTVQEAVGSLRALAPAGLELCEEPVSGLDEIAAVAAESIVPVALDESAALPGALDGALCDAVCLKLSRSGGMYGLIDAARRAREAGYEVYLASMLDGPLGIAAALHAATVIDPDRACGLATLSEFERRPGVLAPSEGRLLPPPGAGLGEGLVSWYGV